MAVGNLLNAAADELSSIDSAASDSFWVLQSGLEIDDEGGYAASGGFSYLPSAQTLAAFNFGVTDSSASLVNFKTTYASVLVDHSFGPVGGSIALGWTGDADTVDRYRYGGSVYFQSGGFRLEVIGENWTSNFKTFEFSRIIDREPSLAPLVITGTANCDLDNTAFGGHVRNSGDIWSIYASATKYDYSKADCAFTGMLGNIDLRRPPDALTDFSPIFFRRLAAATASRIINADAAFLDYSVSAGLSVWVGDKNLALDYFRSEEIFQNLKADTLIASILFPVGLRTDWEMRLGATDQENTGLVFFVGATIFWYTGGGL